MKYLTLVMLVVSWALPALGAEGTGSVAGSVRIESDGPAPGATVTLEGTRFGAAVKDDGTFVIQEVPAGVYGLRARLVGYEQVAETTVTVLEGRTARVAVMLRQAAIELNQIVVTGSRARGAEDVRSSVTRLLPSESKRLAGGAEDVLRSLQALPGVTSVSDFSAQLVVRGSGPDQNLILIDGFEVLNPYRLYGFVSMFNPETVSDISLQSGGFSARYGDRLSAVLDVKNREGRSDRAVGGKLNASLTNLNAVVEGGLPFGEGSYLLSVRRTYYDLILGPVLKSARLVGGDVALPNFGDLQAKVAFSLAPSSRLFLTAFTSRDGVSLISGVGRDRPDSVNVFDESTNTLLGATWQFTPSTELVLQTQLSWYRNDGAGAFDGTFVDPSQNSGELGRADTAGLRFVRFGVDYGYAYTKSTLTQRVLWNTGTHLLEFGAGVDILRTDFTRFFEVDETFRQFLLSQGQPVPTDLTETVSYGRYHLFVDDRIGVGSRLFLEPGLRLDVYPALGRNVYVSPRLGVSYRLDDVSTLRAAYGIYNQSPGMEKNDFRSRVAYTEQWLSTLVTERAQHYILGYNRLFGPEWEFRVETYYKDFSRSVVPEKLLGSRWVTTPTGADPLTLEGWGRPVLVASDSLTNRPVNDAAGSSYGVEVLFQKIRSLPADRFSGWMGYALSFAERIRDGIRTPYVFDQRHAVNVVGNYRFAERWDVGVRFTLRSGRPFQQAVGVKPRVVVQDVDGSPVGVLQTDEAGKVILDADYEQETYSGRLNLYHTLDIRVTTYPGWWGLDWSVYLDVQNVYNRQNEQQMRYYIGQDASLQRRPVYGIPVFPSLGFSLSF